VKSQSLNSTYKSVMQLLIENNLEFLVGGAYALAHYTGIARDTKDLDLLLRPADVNAALSIWRQAGYSADFEFSHWLAKVRSKRACVDVIFCSGNGLATIDDIWFAEAREADILGMRVRVTPPEELIWQKAYIMERERFDGADVAHLLANCASQINWPRLMQRFELDWRVLWSHLVLFGFIFPAKRHLIPLDVVKEFNSRIVKEHNEAQSNGNCCNGTLLSRIQYLSDVTSGGLLDAREDARCQMTLGEIQRWTAAAGNR
jgi:Uncharacterised nucleotidyltransferase